MSKKGLSIHCHHDILIEYCYDYDERVEAIKRDKSASEQEIRLRLFKLLPQKAIDDLPKGLTKADTEQEKAYTEWKKADTEQEKAYAEWKKAYTEQEKAYTESVFFCSVFEQILREKADCETWHKKWCGCKEWNGREIIF